MNATDFTPHEQYFPTYRFRKGSNEAALKEYEAAIKILENDERIFSASIGFFVGGSGILFAALSQAHSEFFNEIGKIFGERVVLYFGWIIVLFMSLLSSSYFADKTAAIVHAARKIIVLRRMLGISYGLVDMVLPSNRIEGADEPFEIKMFSGWISYKILPAYIIGILFFLVTAIVFSKYSSTVLYDLNAIKAFFNFGDVPLFTVNMIPILMGSLSFLAVLFYFRIQLYERHENIWQSIGKFVSGIMIFDLKANWAYIIYRIRLGVEESRRIGLDLKQFYPILTQIEDRKFFSHYGFSARTIGAPLYRYLKYRKLSGGSTITQQFVRSNFFVSYNKKFRRKCAELVFALWAERAFEKHEIIDYYLVSVRFASNVIGIDQAFRYFFPQAFSEKERRKNITNMEMFFLIERLSTISSTINSDKIVELLRHLVSTKTISPEECVSIPEIYEYQIDEKRINPSEAQKIGVIRAKVMMLTDPSGVPLYQRFGPPGDKSGIPTEVKQVAP
jgi:penicillin-binding protein 1A